MSLIREMLKVPTVLVPRVPQALLLVPDVLTPQLCRV
jgi:hypothetical protein